MADYRSPDSSRIARVAACVVIALMVCNAGTTAAEDVVRDVFDRAAIRFDESIVDGTSVGEGREMHRVLLRGQAVQKTVNLPPIPDDQRDARRIVARVVVEPVLQRVDGKVRPGDPWTRTGSVSIVRGDPTADFKPADHEWEDRDLETYPDENEIEVMRFVTGFGGRAVFEQDVTSLAPLLSGPTTLRVYISTYADPAWRVSVSLTWSEEGVGQRRPVFAEHLFNEQYLNAQENRLRARVTIPRGLDDPRIRLISTGHKTDEYGGDEFISRTHILRVDGEEIARFRPWSEKGGSLRSLNPMSGRQRIDGRELWSSDLDRTGWHPGLVVEPLIIPVPELTPGEHEVTLEVLEIRPEDPETGALGYWRVSATVVADEPWPPAQE